MKLKITFLTLAAAALTASAAIAAPPAGKGKPATSPSSTHPATPTVMFVLHGTITGYTAVNGATNGSVTTILPVAGADRATCSGRSAGTKAAALRGRRNAAGESRGFSDSRGAPCGGGS